MCSQTDIKLLHVCVLCLLCILQALAAPRNIALSQSTERSSRSSVGGLASAAVDGVYNATYANFDRREKSPECFVSVRGANQWWRLDLDQKYYITGISIYTGSPRFLMGEFYVITNSDPTKLHPRTYYSSWNEVLYVEDAISTVHLDIEPLVYDQYLAIYMFAFGRILLTEVEVYGYAVTDLAPINLQYTEITENCVTFTWSSEDENNTVGIDYQHKCHTATKWKDSGVDRMATVCGLSPTPGMECIVRVKGHPDLVASVTVPCQEEDFPGTPTTLFLGSRKIVMNLGRKRWRGILTWEDPETYGCLHSTSPYRLQIDDTVIENYNLTSYTLYRDGGVDITFTIWLRYKNGNLSPIPATKKFTTSSSIAPQIFPRNFVIKPVSSACILLSWDPVEYPNGPVSEIRYQYECTSIAYRLVPEDNLVCGYPPSKKVTCSLRARRRTSPGVTFDSKAVSSTTYTLCEDLPSAEVIEISEPVQILESGRQRWQYTISWQELSNFSCIHSESPYTIMVDNEVIENYTMTNYTLYKDGYVSLNFSVWVRRDTGEVIPVPLTKFITTSVGLPPQIAPRDFKLNAVSANCITYSWNPVEYSNAPEEVLVYESNCSDNTWTEIPSHMHRCGYTPRSLVTCEIRAKIESNSDGNKYSEVSTATVITNCGDAREPVGLKFGTPVQVLDSDRKRWRYDVTWQEPETYGCIHPTSPYQLQIDGMPVIESYNQSSYILFRDGGAQVNITIAVRLENGEVSNTLFRSITTSTDIPPQVKPLNFKLSSDSPNCIRMSWENIEYTNGPEADIVYQVNCNEGAWSNVSSSKQLCGFIPNALLSCGLRARRESNSEGNRDSDVSVANITTPCSEPEAPRDLIFGAPSQVTESGRVQWRYEITWKEPETYGCLHSTSPYRVQIDDTVIENYNLTSYTLYRDGGVNITVTVWLRHQDGKLSSSAANEFLTTSTDIAPQTAPRNFQLAATNSSCVSLSWNPVEYPNGPENELLYQSKCGNESNWTVVTGDKQTCGLPPNSVVTCSLRAFRETNTESNSASESATASTITPCSESPVLNAISFNTPTEAMDSGRKRWEYTISWQIPDDLLCLHSTSPYRLQIDDTVIENYNLTSYTLYRDGAVNLTVTVWLRLQDGVLSEPTTAALLTPTADLSPQVAPMNFQLTAVSPYCVSLSWDPVQYPNGPENGIVYQTKCRNSSGWTDIPESREICGFEPNSLVSCLIRAFRESNSNGTRESRAAESNTTTLCALPVSPLDLLLGKFSQVFESSRVRWEHTASWQEPETYGCIHSTSPYRLQIDDTVIENYNLTSYTLYRDGGVNITVTVWLRHQDGELSQPVTDTITTSTDIAPQVAPGSFRLTAVSPTCVSLSWDPVQYPNGPVSEIVYQSKCGSESNWTVVKEDKQTCGFSPNSVVTCSLRAFRETNTEGNRESESATASATTPCSDLVAPENLTFAEPVEVINSGRKRWEYAVTWQEPETYGCLHSTSPYRLQIDDTVIENYNLTSYTLCRDGGVNLAVTVWVRLADGRLSATPNTNKVITSTNIAPQVAPRNFTVKVVSASCVTLSWNPVEYPNGPVDEIVYQSKCGAALNWTTIPEDGVVCGLLPNTEQTCEVRADRHANSEGKRFSQSVTDTIKTPCDGPNQPLNLSFGIPSEVNDSNRRRWSYTISWQDPETYGCVHSTSPYRLQIDDKVIENYNLTSYTLYRDGGVNITVTVWLRHQDGELSDPATSTITTSTDGLPPQVAPRSFQLTAVSPYCVSLSWDPVQYPNGPESEILYQVKCESFTNWTTIPDDKIVCGFTPNSLVSCEIRARRESNSVGDRDSESITAEVKMNCGDPTQPEGLLFSTPTQSFHSGRKRWSYAVSWKEPETYGCIHSTSPYRLQIDDTVIENYNQTSYTLYRDGGVNITVTVWLRHQDGEISDPVTDTITTSTDIAPQVAPRRFQIRAESSSCVDLSWKPVEYSNGPEEDLEYEVQCEEGVWSTAPSDNFTSVCGFGVNSSVTCQVRASRLENSEGNKHSDTAIATVLTHHCPEPPAPEKLNIIQVTRKMNSGRLRWECTVTWEEPETYGCLHSTSPYRLQIDDTVIENYNQTRYTLYRDGGVNITVTVGLRLQDGELSDPVTATITTSTNIAPQVAPRNFQLAATNSSCVSLSWDPVQYPNGPENDIVYQHKCGIGNWTDLPEDRKVCGFSPNSVVPCEIRARRESNSEGTRNSGSSRAEVTTSCNAPVPVKNMAIGEPTEVSNAGRRRWKYVVEWEEPETYGCLHSTSPYRLQIDDTVIENYNLTSYTLYRDGGVYLIVVVRLRHQDGKFSDPVADIVFNTPFDLAPQVAPRNFQLTAVSPYCVSLSWDPLEYPNGDEGRIVYQSSCNGETWNEINRDRQLCGYSPFQLISCKIRGVDDNRASETAFADAVRTFCIDPKLPTDLFSYITQGRHLPAGSDSEERIQIRLYIPPQNITANCESITSVEYRVDGGPYLSNNETYGDLSPYTNYTVEVRAANNKGMDVSMSISIQTLELEPYDAPILELAQPLNQTCVYLRWREPTQPNGVIINYQSTVSTEPNPAWADHLPQSVNELESCDHSAGTKIRYRVKAATSAGYGPAAIGTVRTDCDVPESPSFEFNSFTEVIDKRERISLNVSWQDPIPACDSIEYYNLTIILESQKIFQDQITGTKATVEDLNPYTNYTVTLLAVNNEGLQSDESEATKLLLTPQLAPYDGPGVELKLNTSCAILNLQQPKKPNGMITHYQYTCDYADSETSSYTNISVTEVQPHTVCGFRSAEKIECRVIAVNTAGESLVTSVTGYTQVEVSESKILELKIEQNSGTSVPLKIYPAKVSNNEVRSYVLIVREIKNESGRKKRSYVPPVDCEQEVLTNYSQRGDSPCYITAEVSSSDVNADGFEIEVGDGKVYGGFYNAPLTPSGSYKLYQGVKVTTEDGQVLTEYLPSSVDVTLVEVTTDPQGPENKQLCDKNCVIGLSVAGSILLLVIIALIIYCCAKRYGTEGKDETDNVEFTSFTRRR